MDNNCTECVKAAVDKLIANKATAYNETHRPWLETLSEEQLELMNPQPASPAVHKKVTKEEAITVLSELSQEEYLKTMPKALREQVESGLRVNAERRTAMIEKINANASHFTKEELAGMSTDMLEKLYVTVNKEEKSENDNIQFFGFSPAPIQANEEVVEPLLPLM